MGGNRTSGDVPYPDFTLAPSRDEQIGRGIVIKAEYIACVALERLGSGALKLGLKESELPGLDEHTEFTFHIRIVVSSEADAKKTLSDDHAMSETPSVCPFRSRISSPVYGDQIFITLSFATVQSRQMDGF